MNRVRALGLPATSKARIDPCLAEKAQCRHPRVASGHRGLGWSPQQREGKRTHPAPAPTCGPTCLDTGRRRMALCRTVLHLE
eukprot:1124917-Amphidinium_carterae.1